MKITDSIGNELKPGHKLYWKQADLYLIVKDTGVVNDGKVATLKLELDMGVSANKDSANFPMFIRVVSPGEEERALEVVKKAMVAS